MVWMWHSSPGEGRGVPQARAICGVPRSGPGDLLETVNGGKRADCNRHARLGRLVGTRALRASGAFDRARLEILL